MNSGARVARDPATDSNTPPTVYVGGVGCGCDCVGGRVPHDQTRKEKTKEAVRRERNREKERKKEGERNRSGRVRKQSHSTVHIKVCFCF